MTDYLLLLAGGLLLYFGAEWFVGGASSLALALRVPQLIVGLTVVAFGTSAPEVIVGVQAARTGHGEVSLGNVLGSNIANIGLILGVSVLVRPAVVDGSLRRREVPVLLLTASLVPLLLLDGAVSRLEAAGLLACALGYTAWMVATARGETLREARIDAGVAVAVADVAGAPRVRGPLTASLTTAVGLGVLLVGGHLFVSSAVSVARLLGLSDRLVGLTIVAVGTSLPELVTSVVAARRGHSDLAVGNVVGSNIFNVLLCLGAAATAAPLHASLRGSALELASLLGMTVLAAVYTRRGRLITRPEGALALALYVAFLAWTVARR